VSSPCTIIHLDLDAFFCAVKEQRDPSLRGKAFAVGGRPESRGVVASASYAARQFGVRSAIPMAQAVRLCPNLLVVPPNFSAYRAASLQVMERLQALTPLVEQISIDEAFLDVTALGEPGEVIAARLQATIRDELALSCSLGVAGNKLVAKVATDVGKSLVRSGKMPQAICMVPPREEGAFLAPCQPQHSGALAPRPPRSWPSWASTPLAILPPGLPLTWRGALASMAKTWRGVPKASTIGPLSLSARQVDLAGDHLCPRYDRQSAPGADAASRVAGADSREPGWLH
jgi:hypothetical protein